MCRFITSTLTALFLVVVTQGTISGAGSPPQWGGGGRPPGDYQQTCRDIRWNGSLLNANCQKRDGGWRNSSLDYRSCRGPVINDNGYLRCGTNAGPGYGGAGYGNLPRGDYKRTCQNMRMEGNKLVANCQKTDGGWRSSSLNNAYQCRNVYNDNGHLRCGT